MAVEVRRGDRHIMAQTIIRSVHVDRTKTAEQIIDATGCERWKVREDGLKALAAMPQDGRKEEAVEFFEVGYAGYAPSIEEVDREYKARGLRPDPAAVAQALIDDPTLLTDRRAITVQWRDNNVPYHVNFWGMGGGRLVSICWVGYPYSSGHRFAGVRK